MKKIAKYQPEIPFPPARDLEEAKRIAFQICEAFAANFQNSETDMAHMITDKFQLREPNGMNTSLGRDILRVIAEELGGYEVNHPAMRGMVGAVHARIIIALHEHGVLSIK